LANQGGLRLIAEKCRRSKYAVWTAIDVVCSNIFVNHQKVIQWPNVASLADFAAKFEERAGFPGMVGSIDGCYVPINPPRKHQRDFLNYK